MNWRQHVSLNDSRWALTWIGPCGYFYQTKPSDCLRVFSCLLFSTETRRQTLTDILDNAQKVCRQWRRVCKDPSMWQKIDMRSRIRNERMLDRLASMCRHAVDRSQGGLVEIHLGNFVNNDLLDYIADRSRNLRILGLGMCFPRATNPGLVDTIAKLPLLETLEVSHSCLILDFKAIGQACPHLKTFKLNSSGRFWSSRNFRNSRYDDYYALEIAENMPELRHLYLYGNKLSDIGLNAILNGCPHLEHLELHKCFELKLVGDLEKRCSERIKYFRHTNK